jgi:hypothetical protein
MCRSAHPPQGSSYLLIKVPVALSIDTSDGTPLNLPQPPVDGAAGIIPAQLSPISDGDLLEFLVIDDGEYLVFEVTNVTAGETARVYAVNTSVSGSQFLFVNNTSATANEYIVDIDDVVIRSLPDANTHSETYTLTNADVDSVAGSGFVYTNTATVTSEVAIGSIAFPASDTDSAGAPVTYTVSLELAKLASPSTVDFGDTFAYTFIATTPVTWPLPLPRPLTRCCKARSLSVARRCPARTRWE